MKKNHTLRRHRLLLAASAVLLALGGWGWHRADAAAATPESAPASAPALTRQGSALVVQAGSPLRQALEMATLAAENVIVPFTLPAVVEADPARVVKVLTPAAGRIASLDKRLGDMVRPGDLLMTIDAADLAQARADDAKARAALALAGSNLVRQRALEADDIAARRDLEQARSDADQAASEAARTATRLAQLGSRGGGGGGLLALRSPIAGRVVELAAGAGGYWNDVTAPLMVVADLSRVYVAANAQEKDLAGIHEGQPVAVTFDAFAGAVDARVNTLGWSLDPVTRTVKVRMALDNRAARLRPGMFASASFSAPPRRAILVPLAAIVQDGFASRAFVEVAPWRFEARTLRLGAQVGERVEVAAGLRAGERIVVKDAVMLHD